MTYQRLFDAIAAATSSALGRTTRNVSVTAFYKSLGVDALYTTPPPAASVASNVVDVSEIKGLLSEVDDYLNGCPNPEKVWPKWLIKKSSRLLWRCRSILSNHLLPRNVDSEADTGGRSDGE